MTYRLMLLVALTALPAFGQTLPLTATAASSAGPRLSFEAPKFNFGVITTGAVLHHVFEFKNTGTQPLLISNIGVSCGCTSPTWTRTPVMPGQRGKVQVVFNSAGKSGMQNKILTVESNSLTGTAVLALVGSITAR